MVDTARRPVKGPERLALQSPHGSNPRHRLRRGIRRRRCRSVNGGAGADAHPRPKGRAWPFELDGTACRDAASRAAGQTFPMSDRDFETGERMKDETQPHDLQQASPLYVASLARGMVLLESFRDGAPLLGITDLVRITGFEKNLVQRLTNTLYQMGYLGKDQARRKYYLTPRILTHSFNYLRSRKLFALAMPALIDLREDLHKAVNMCVLNGTDITYVVRLWLKYYHEASLFGESLPSYSSAGGRMLLSFFSDEDALALIEGMERRKLTPHTRVDPMELLDEVRKAREQGYCWQAGEFIEKEISVSAPVSDADGKPAAIIVTSLLKKVTPETCQDFIDETLPSLLATASSISRLAGAPA
ncbi:IclR family transcriptional regulator [Bilophila sp.]|uniref:IclR family transcriptional regulator n=2 Tax=Bilophila TaxID=35832 RepID=UPI00257AA0B1|nr:IclR family transcriptional regulator [Bilophila sp.]